MRLSELMSNIGSVDLAFYPQVALIIFLVVFVGVVAQVVSRKKSEDYQRAAELPLED